jgi:hypothetical protein
LPGETPEECYRAIAEREILAARTLPLPNQLVMLCGPGLYIPSAEKKIKALESFLQVYKRIIPTNPEMTRAHLWHSDLHDENIFVDPQNPSEITGLIDWQSTQIAPLLNHPLDPAFLNSHSADKAVLKSTATRNTSGISRSEEAIAIEERLAKSPFLAFRMVTESCPALYKTIAFHKTLEYRILHLSRRIFQAGEAHFRSCIADLTDVWSSDPNVQPAEYPEPLPSSFNLSERELIELIEEVSAAERGIEVMSEYKKRLGSLWPEKGAVPHEVYAEAKKKLHELKIETITRFAKSQEARKEWESFWPFDD